MTSYLISLQVGYGMVENVKELLKLHEGIKHEVYLDNENSSIVPQEVVDEMPLMYR